MIVDEPPPHFGRINSDARKHVEGGKKMVFQRKTLASPDKRMQMEEKGREGGTLAGRVGRPRGRGRGVERRRKEVEQRRGRGWQEEGKGCRRRVDIG